MSKSEKREQPSGPRPRYREQRKQRREALNAQVRDLELDEWEDWLEEEEFFDRREPIRGRKK